VLLRSSWQTVNIGDIAHTPGMLALLERHLPETRVTLWPNTLSPQVERMLRARFPKLHIARANAEKDAALGDCDFCLHGSGPGLVGRRELYRWRESGKPYGFGGVTLSDNELRDDRDLLDGARFLFCRDSLSLAAARAAGVKSPLLDFGPDATFHLDLRADEAADAFLKRHGVEPGGFACFVPRLRWTPYWEDGRRMDPAEVARKEAENERHREADHAKLRDAVAAWVTKTGRMALLCPEMTYQVDLLRPLLFDALPAEVKPKVVVRPDYWLTDEAASTYARAAAVVSLEMHSPIIAVAAGTPAVHVRQPTDTRKGQMWRDVGLGDWLFEVERTSGEEIAAALLGVARDEEAARVQVKRANQRTADAGRAMVAAMSV
jgi:polysaccharide pyruvyl transferase WcaK-like protein